MKLSDFGLGALLPRIGAQDGMLMTTCGTPNYVAPEVLKKTGYHGGPADVWSAGAVELFCISFESIGSMACLLAFLVSFISSILML